MALATILGQALIPHLTYLGGAVTQLRGSLSFTAALALAISALLELLPAIGMGILFPLFVHLARARVGEAGSAVGSIYAWNTFGTLVGATEEHAGFDARTTAAGIRGLLDVAVRLVPDLAAAHLERTWAGLRPGNADGKPYLGRAPGWENLFVATGHLRAGLQLSTGTAQLMTDFILDRPSSIPADAFRLDRSPAEADEVPAFRS